ncbi:MAG TPA: hypothetical protein VGE11_00405 [Pseudonocardia sp.]
MPTPPENLKRSCGSCGATWYGPLKAHCGVGGCHRTFQDVAMFDRHRVADSCANPASLGMVLVGATWSERPAAPRRSAS